MRFPSYAVKGAVLLSLLTTPAYADQSFVNMIRSMSVKQIAEFSLRYNHDTVVRKCRAGKSYNANGLSYFNYTTSYEYLTNLTKKANMPYDVVKKNEEGYNYAMYSVCPDVY